MMKKIYPRTGDTQTVYLNAVVKDPSIEVGDYTIYNDFVAHLQSSVFKLSKDLIDSIHEEGIVAYTS